MDWLLDLLGLNRGKATIAAADENQATLSGLAGEIDRLIGAGTAKQQGYLDDSLGLIDLGDGGNGMVRDALGLGGDAGKARATAAFRDFNPGYDFMLETGLDAIDRRAASRGMLGSGNTNIDTINYASGVADQQFGDWFDRLLGGVDRQTAAQGDLATLFGQDTDRRIGLAEGIGNTRMELTNQRAEGEEMGQGWLLDTLGAVGNVAGRFAGGGAFDGFGRGMSTSPRQRMGYGAGF